MARQRRQQGFTVLEVLVAVVILAVAYVAILQNFSLALKNLHRVDQRRGEFLDSMLAFDQLLASIDPADLPEGDVFLEGAVYRLRWVTSDDGLYTTLVLEQR